MSKVGEKPIKFDNSVKVNIDGQNIAVEGPKGSLSLKVRPEIKVAASFGKITVQRIKDDTKSKSLHGLTRTLIGNMVFGVTSGWSKSLELSGVGYRGSIEGENLVLNVGFSHQVRFKMPPAINITVAENKITVNGVDKQLVGETAAQIRRIRPPEPYKGKGIKYLGEKIRRKAGKAAKAIGAISAGVGAGSAK